MYEFMVLCLALNIYHEAAFEPLEGQTAVAYVTLNRSLARNQDVCDAVFQDRQFSWTIGNLIPVTKNGERVGWKVTPAMRPPNTKQWRDIKALAVNVMSSYQQHTSPYKNLTHYHADYMHPYPAWAKQKVFKLVIGHHLFYSDPAFLQESADIRNQEHESYLAAQKTFPVMKEDQK